MSTKPTLLRLRETTVEKLKLVLKQSAHRSMASLADEILDEELTRRLDIQHERLSKFIESARRSQ